MKKVIAGLGFIFSGGIFYISAFIVGALNVSNTSLYETSLGRFWGTISNYDIMLPIWVGIILILIGLLFIIWGVFERESISRK